MTAFLSRSFLTSDTKSAPITVILVDDGLWIFSPQPDTFLFAGGTNASVSSYPVFIKGDSLSFVISWKDKTAQFDENDLKVKTIKEKAR